MSIVIPSRCIYQKTNDKILDNVIKGVEVGATKISPNNKYQEVVYDEIIPFETFTYDSVNNQSPPKFYDTDGFFPQFNAERYIRGAGKLEVTYNYVDTNAIYIPKVQNNSFIQKIYDASSGERSVKLKYTIEQSVYESDCYYTPSTNTFSTPNSYKLVDTQIISNAYDYSYSTLLSTERFNFDESQFSNYKGTFDIKCQNGNCDINYRLYLNDNRFNSGAIDIKLSDGGIITESAPTITEETIDGIDYYVVDYVYGSLAGFNITYYIYCEQSKSEFKNNSNQRLAKATLIKQTIKQVTLTVYGDSEGIEAKEITIKYGDESNPYSTDGNELLQVDATIRKVNLTEHIANNIRNHYKNGKETSTILCSISDYYNTDGEKVISTEDVGVDKMTFDIYDEVLPQVRNEYGKDVPISLNSEGKAKTFRVLGSRIYYDGAVWQELSLQEYASVDIVSNYYEITISANTSYIGFQIKGKGKIFINGVLIEQVNFIQPTIWERDAEASTDYKIKFDGSFDEISTISYSTEILNIVNLGVINEILHWDDKMYPNMFSYQPLDAFHPQIPSQIKTIPQKAFYGAYSGFHNAQYFLEIPETIEIIENGAFSDSLVPTFKFNHSENQFINLPNAGSETGMFYSKNATSKKIYTDNIYIRNYDFVSDNITATFYHLDGTLWE